MLATAVRWRRCRPLARGGSQARSPSVPRRPRRTTQLAIESASPKLAVTEEVLPLRIPRPHHWRDRRRVQETRPVTCFVYSRTGWSGSSRGGNSARLFEFDQNLKYVKEWLPELLWCVVCPWRWRVDPPAECLGGG